MAAMCTTRHEKKNKKNQEKKHTLRTEVLALTRAEQTTTINTLTPTRGNGFKQKSQRKKEKNNFCLNISLLQQLYATHKSSGSCKAAQSIKCRTISISIFGGEGQIDIHSYFPTSSLGHVFVCGSAPLELLTLERYHRITTPKTCKAT